jgi:predicted amidohydrolase YtcJ
MFAEARRGEIAAGRDADLSIFDRDLVACAPSEIPKAGVRMTISGGKTAFRAP